MIRVRRAQDKDIKRVTELLAQVLELHADLRPDLFIHGTTKYTENQLSDIFADEKTPVFVAVDDCDTVQGYAFCILKEPAFAKPEEFMTIQVQETARLCAMLEALAQLSKAGKKVAYNIEGPLTLLCALLPMNKVFSALRKPIGKQMLSQVEEWIVRYAEMAVERGAKIISFADPIATVDILGSQMFVNQYVPCLLQLLIRLQERFPDTVIHLCGKLTQSLIDTKQCTLTRWEGQKGQSYGQTLTEFCGKGGIVGHYCLNYLGANRNYLELIDFTEKRNENER